MIVRVRTPGNERWHHDVVGITSNGDHLYLTFARPKTENIRSIRTAVWIGNDHTRVNVFASEAEVSDALREERANQQDMDARRRI